MITKDRFVKKMNLAMFTYKMIDENSEIVLKIANSFRKYFPKKVDEINHYMFELDFGKCGEEYQSPEDFYHELLK